MDANDWYMMGSALQSFNNTLANNANVILASQTSKQDRKFSREMSDVAWQRNLESWNMQNEYNLPANQYARQLEGLRVNGLNPNLVYGSSSSIGGAAGSVAPYKFDGWHSTAVPRFGDLSINDLLNTRLLQTQVAAQEANVRLLNTRADVEEARLPGVRAKGDEAAARWNYILDHMDDQQAAWRALQALDYWKGQQAYSNAEILKNKASMSYYEAAMAEWLNTTLVPGTELTFKQYYESYRSMMPAASFNRALAEVHNIASQIAYRKKQGELLDLKQEYQRAVNKFAWLGRSLGNNWVNTLFSGLMWLYDNWDNLQSDEEPKDPVRRGASELGDW